MSDVMVARGVTAALLGILLAAPSAPGPEATPPSVFQDFQRLPATSRQVVLVVTGDWTATRGTLERFERRSRAAAWKAVGTTVPVVVGRNGLAWGQGSLIVGEGGTNKKEGDGKAPAGAFRLESTFGHSKQPSVRFALPYMVLTDDLECVDDPKSDFYNFLVSRTLANSGGHVDWTTSEKMLAEPLYKWGIRVRYNYPRTERGAGSCIFLHIWKGPDSSTAGCTAMSESDLLDVMKWLDQEKDPLLVQLPKEEFVRLNAGFHLPV